MNKEKNKIIQFAKNITEYYKQNRYQDIIQEFEKNTIDFNSFYSLSARLKYIHSIALRKISKSYQLWFQESSICFSPNYLPFIPVNYFDEWIDTFYSVGKEDCEQWIPRNISLTSVKNEITFLNVNASFNKKIVFESDPAEIEVSLISTFPKEIRDASIAVQVLSKTANEDANNSHTNNSQNKPKMIIIAEHQSILPNKRLFFRSCVFLSDQSNNALDVTLTDVILIINSIKLVFGIDSSLKKNFRSENPNRSQEIRIEPKDIGCSLVANLPPPGFVDVPAPIHLKFSTSDLAGYSIILKVACPRKDKKDTFISLNPEMSDEMGNVKIDVEKPFKEYNLTFYAFSHIPKEINLQLNWHVQKNDKNGKLMIQELPLEFHFPFILSSKIFYESSSCRTEINLVKTPLLTESTYSILTEFTSNCPWPITIKSFEIIPENENEKDEENYIRKRFSDVNSNIIDTDTKNDNPSIAFQKPIINLPIMLEPNDRFSAFTKFSTCKKHCKSTNLGSLFIRYFMHSTIYKGIHLYTLKLPSNETISNSSKNQTVPSNIISNSNISRKSSNIISKKSFNKFVNKSTKNSNRNSSNLASSKILINSNNNNNNNAMATTSVCNTKMVSIEKLKLHVEFDFPSRGSQFEMCELTIKLTNVSETPLEIVLDIKPSTNFLMAGTLSTQIGLFPFDPTELSLKFFPLAHGSLTFPEISINSAQSWDYCYWSAKPTIFISYPVAS